MEEEARWKEWELKKEQEEQRELEELEKSLGLHTSCYISMKS